MLYVIAAGRCNGRSYAASAPTRCLATQLRPARSRILPASAASFATKSPPPAEAIHLSEAAMRRELAIAHRLAHDFGWSELVWNHISGRVGPPPTDPSARVPFLITNGKTLYPFMRPEDLSLNTDTENETGDVIHGALYTSRPDINAVVHTHTTAVTAVSALAGGLRHYTQDSCEFYGRVGYHEYEGISTDPTECDRIAAALGATNHTLIMRNHGAVTTGASVGEAWVRMYYLDRVCRVQLQVMQSGDGVEVAAEMCERVQEQFKDFSPGDYEWDAMVDYCERALMNEKSSSF